MNRAVIILGHGSRTEGSGGSLSDLAETLRSTGRFLWVEQAFLQYAPPFLDEAVRRCVDHGASEIVLVPFFLQAGAHVTRDIPAKIAELQKRNPSVRFKVTEHVGCHPIMMSIVAELAGKIE